MPSQLVAYATQSSNASWLDPLDDELDELENDPVAHMFSSDCRQLAPSRELEDEDDVPKHGPHFAMTLSTALSHLDDNEDEGVNVEGQPAPAKATTRTAKLERTDPRSARFMSLLPASYLPSISAARAGRSGRWTGLSQSPDR